MVEWVPRLADIPGVAYVGSSTVNRSRIPGYSAQPQVEVYAFDGKRRETLYWPSTQGKTSASPAKQHASNTANVKSESSKVILKRLYETLELPGEPIDYHFAIQGCVDELWSWKRRRLEPVLLSTIEQLCWLDIRLIEAMPHIIAYDHRGEQRYYGVTAFGHLIELYEREGFLADALDVARRASRFNPQFPKLQELEQRRARVLAEANG
jgi:hypothetical protein